MLLEDDVTLSWSGRNGRVSGRNFERQGKMYERGAEVFRKLRNL
jgi:hypothetical protein